MKAIETRYKGYRFRSRLEARWAVFFDALGIKWEYEPEGFELGFGERYLPDFFVRIHTDWAITEKHPNAGYWVEIKASSPTKGEQAAMQNLCSLTGHHGYIVHGVPAENTVMRFNSSGPMVYSKEGEDFIKPIQHILDDPDWQLYYSAFVSMGTSLSDKAEPRKKYDRAVSAARSARFEHGENGQ